jgi:hypothetical protein
MPCLAAGVGVILVAVGLWLLRGHYSFEFAFYRRYEPRPMAGMLCVVRPSVLRGKVPQLARWLTGAAKVRRAPPGPNRCGAVRR